LSDADVEKRDRIIEQALKPKGTTKRLGMTFSSVDRALEETSEIGITAERRGMEEALRAAREEERRRRRRAILVSIFAFVSFTAAALIGGWGFGLFTLPTEAWLVVLGLGGLGFALLTFYALK
jgi:Flp pilus assembly protein TadB